MCSRHRVVLGALPHLRVVPPGERRTPVLCQPYWCSSGVPKVLSGICGLCSHIVFPGPVRGILGALRAELGAQQAATADHLRYG